MSQATLNGLRVVVTGGLGALGRTVGRVLTERGARVTLLDRATASAVAGIAAVLGAVDLSDPASAARDVDQAVDATHAIGRGAERARG